LSHEDEDLEEYWNELRPKPLVQAEWPSSLEAALDMACEQTLYDLKNSMRHYLVENEVMMAHYTLDRGVRGLKTNWLNELAGKNATGLIEFILRDAGLTPREMRDFVQALPRSLLNKICASTFNTANGIHALMGVEVARREYNLRNYSLTREGGRIRVNFTREGEEVTFYLDEGFDLIEERLQTPPGDENEPPF